MMTGLLPCPRCGSKSNGWSAGRFIEGEALKKDKKVWAEKKREPSEWVCHDCAIELGLKQP